jgi:hypothetical protein
MESTHGKSNTLPVHDDQIELVHHWPGFEGESEMRRMFDHGMGP